MYKAQRGKLREREAAEGRELILCAERGRRWGWGGIQEKHAPKKQLERKWKSGNSRRDRTKKGERRKERV